MTTQHLNFDQLYELVSRKGRGNQLESLKKHIQGCEKCANELSFIESVYQSMYKSRENVTKKPGRHISKEFREKYFQYNLPQKDIDSVHRHLVNCSDCFEEFSAISATAFVEPSKEEKSILKQIEAAEVQDRLAPYKKQFIITRSPSFKESLTNFFKNKNDVLSIPRLATGLVFVLVLGVLGYQQITLLNLLNKSSRAFYVVLEKNKIGPEVPRLIDSVAKLSSPHRGEKSEQPEIRTAEVALLNALERKPEDAKLNHQLGTVYFFAGEMDKAEEFYLKAINLDLGKAEVYNDLALIDINQNKFEKALARLNHALQLNPNLLEAQYNLAIVFELRNETSNAIQAWEKYLELDSDANSDWKRLARGRLGELRE